MNRRDFFKSLLAAGVVAVADPERLLWMPGEKMYFTITKPQLVSYDIETVNAIKAMISIAVKQFQSELDKKFFATTFIIDIPHTQVNQSTNSWLGLTRK